MKKKFFSRSNEVIKVLSEFLKIDKLEIQLNAKLIEDLGFDSIDFIEVFTRLNEIQNLKGHEEEIANLKTVEDILKLMEKAQNAQY